MLFNSLEFLIFCPVVFILYWTVFRKNINTQNLFIVISSCVFYGWWDWRFLILLLASAIIDFIVARLIQKTTDLVKRKMLLLVSISFNIGVLIYFKYFNFFIDSFNAIFSSRYLSEYTIINIILPVGISFYSLQTLGYVIDVYRKNVEPTKKLITFIAFVSFFPQLVAGPIERAKNLLPQFERKRIFQESMATEGLRQILWGLLKKVVVADNCGVFVDQVYSNYESSSGIALVVATFLFSIQIYCDFSGYSEIALGTGKLFGFSLMQNFHYPYFSKSIVEFWRRWHISLTTWFRDYIYIPLGGSRISSAVTIQNVLIVFLISGLWHGARITFVMWGLINALFFLLEIPLKKYVRISNLKFSNALQAALVFILITFTWIFFRSSSMQQALQIIKAIFSYSIFESFPRQSILPCVFAITLFTIEYLGRQNEFAILTIDKQPRWVRWCSYLIFISIIAFFAIPKQQFIYFQF